MNRRIKNNDELKEIVQANIKIIKSEQDLNKFRLILTKIAVESALNAGLNTPRDRSDFSIRNWSRKGKAASLHWMIRSYFPMSKSMTTRGIITKFNEMYGADISASLIREVPNAIIDQFVKCQSRSLDVIYPNSTLDYIVL